MAAKWRRVRIDIPRELGPAERELISQAIVNKIRERAIVENKGMDAKGIRSKKFVKYEEDYAKEKGVSVNDVTLAESSKMLGALQPLSHKPGSVLIGFKNGTKENAKAEGNIIGSYGGAPNPSKARNFLGLPAAELKRLIKENRNDS